MVVALRDDTFTELKNTVKPFLISPIPIAHKVSFHLLRKFILGVFRRPP